MPTVTPIVVIGKFLDESYLNGKKWIPIMAFDLEGVEVGDSINDVKVTGTFSDNDGNAGKERKCTTNGAGQCSIYGKKRNFSGKKGIDYSDFVLVSLSAGNTVLNPTFEVTVTWIEAEKGTLN